MTMTNTEAAHRLNLMAEAVKLLDGVGVLSMTVYGDDDHILVNGDSLIKYLNTHTRAFRIEPQSTGRHVFPSVISTWCGTVRVYAYVTAEMLEKLEVKK